MRRDVLDSLLAWAGSRRGGVMAALAVIAILCAAGLALPGGVWADRRDVNPHVWSDKALCASCHNSAMPALKLDSVTVCTHCHGGYLGNHPVAKHPIGKRPGINISRRMPLDKKGKLVCYTCHDNHNRSEYPNMLRIGYLQLCAACHRGY
ncbi:MAG: cytochrome c3 family protein [Thermodesulfobacteriota bacterium]